MPRAIFPASFIEFSEESLIQKHSTRSKTIYWLLLLMVLLIGVSIFFIKVDVNIHSNGRITSQEKATHISSPTSGIIKQFYLVENAFINKGDTLLTVDNKSVVRSIETVKEKKEVIEDQNADLLILSQLDSRLVRIKAKLSTPLYIQELRNFKSQLKLKRSEISLLKKEFDRQEVLYNQSVIPIAEYEKTAYRLKNERLQYRKIFDAQLSKWQTLFSDNQRQIIELDEKLNTLGKESENYFISSPISGYVQNLSGVKKDGLISFEQKICSISPTEHLIVESYVSSSDIGLIRLDQEVKLRVDAFNFNQWGVIKGEVTEIGKDIQVQDNGLPAFKIRCKLETTSLTYNTQTVNVKKGMGCTVSFFLTQRTLAQLLYDKLTDWIDPNSLDQ